MVHLDAVLDLSDCFADFLVHPHGYFFEQIMLLQARLDEVAFELLLQDMRGRAILPEL